MEKKIAVVAVLILIALGAIGFIFTGSGPQLSRSNSQTTAKEKNDTSTSGNLTTSTTGQGVSATGPSQLIMHLSSSNRFIPLGGNMSFTLSLYSAGLSGEVSISVSAPPGLTFFANPSTVKMSGSGTAVDLLATSSASATPATYQVTIHARAPTKAYNETFEFHVVPYLVKIREVTGPTSVNLTVTAGSPITWVNLDRYNEDNMMNMNGYHQVTFQSINTTSGILKLGDAWSYTFVNPGVYIYQDSQEPMIAGEIVVTP